MILKQLELQGFKTFAAKTVFTFNSGITAIVGPNGSGKSNIADAIRWVLGEQATRPLRIKRSEDVIFAGTSARPRVGMAEVSITLDNSTKWLPIDFSEVTITRRAYRSGETEYLINKNRVRLRDVIDLLLVGNIGQNSYTVIGQGAIDAALSLRPEERRELFEEAADIKRYQVKRNDALNKLQATENNLVRLRDLMAEIAPRLQSLQVQAQRAQEQERLLHELRSYLAAWYAQRWSEASNALRRAMALEEEAKSAAANGEAELARLEEQLAAVRQRETSLRSQLSDWHRQASMLHAQAETLERTMAATRATLDSIVRQRQEILDELGPLCEHLNARRQMVEDAQLREGELLRACQEQAALVSGLAQEAADLETKRQQAQKRLDSAETELLQAASAIATMESNLLVIAQHRKTILDEIKQRQTQVDQHEIACRNVQQSIDDLTAAVTRYEADRAELIAERSAVVARISAARQEYEATVAAVTAAHEERRTLELRLEALSRLQESLAGYDAGVRSVLQAGRSGSLAGIVGTVASLVHVPQEYEAAISAALGNHEQDIVTTTWQAAESAVEYLRRTRGGRATFLPLDIIKGRPVGGHIEGAIGWAAEVVQIAEAYRNVVSYLLGHVLLVRDLTTARRILDHPAMRAVSSIVTLAGDIVRPGGAITGGSLNVRTSGLLERERELKELPQRICSVRDKEQSLDQKRAAAQHALRQLEVQLVNLDKQLASLQQERDKTVALLNQRQRELEHWQHEIGWLREQQEALQRALANLDAEEKHTSERLATEREHYTLLQTLIADVRRELADTEANTLTTKLAEARTKAALAEQELRAHQRLLHNLTLEVERAEAQVAAKEQRTEELAAEAAALMADLEQKRAQLQELSATITALQERIVPAEANVASLEAERTRLVEEEMQARSHYNMLERACNQAVLETQRARSELSKLQTQIEAEEGLGLRGYGLDEGDVKRMLEELAIPVQLSLAVTETQDVPGQHVGNTSTELLKRRIDSLRSQLRQLGPINPNAVVEYEETLGRYSFLTSQCEDLEKAAKSLRTVIAELDELMHARFEATFEAISREFRHYFTTLFGGGTARLTLTDPDDLAGAGVEIIAQPPGKRAQSLTLLSGGERALTATALLFAILAVNPLPFCVLDEVDAALDDTNVGRFCEVLRSLATRTQFIIITHNKGTMEMASTLYGVSMANDGTSQVLSLKLDDVRAAA